MKAIALLLVAGCLVSVTLSARTVSKFITKQDQDRYGKIFAEGLKSSDLQAVYFSSASAGVTAGDKTPEACKRLVEVYGESKLNEFEKNFYLAGAWKNLACKEPVAAKVRDAIKGALAKDAGSAQEI